VGEGFRCYGSPYIRCRDWSAISIGRNVTIISDPRCNLVGLSQRVAIQTHEGAKIIVDDGVGMSGVVMSARTLIEIGKNVNIGGNTKIFDHDFHSHDPLIRASPQDQQHVASRPVRIEDDVFIGCDVIILKGTRIGARSIIGAGSIVAGLYAPPDSVIAGNPARIIGCINGSKHTLPDLDGK
jgi:acetyltransferase-like isoleucine patch superfamily enzyme